VVYGAGKRHGRPWAHRDAMARRLRRCHCRSKTVGSRRDLPWRRREPRHFRLVVYESTPVPTVRPGRRGNGPGTSALCLATSRLWTTAGGHTHDFLRYRNRSLRLGRGDGPPGPVANWINPSKNSDSSRAASEWSAPAQASWVGSAKAPIPRSARGTSSRCRSEKRVRPQRRREMRTANFGL
jgi:hypothetical protein